MMQISGLTPAQIARNRAAAKRNDEERAARHRKLGLLGDEHPPKSGAPTRPAATALTAAPNFAHLRPAARVALPPDPAVARARPSAMATAKAILRAGAIRRGEKAASMPDGEPADRQAKDLADQILEAGRKRRGEA
jgi:hypothetical protein